MTDKIGSSIKVVVIGDSSVGKSAISIRYIQNIFVDKYEPTIEETYRRVVEVDGVCFAVDVMDTAGQEEFQSLRETLIKIGDGFMLVYSITSARSFDVCQEMFEMVYRMKEGNPALVLVGNKIDLESEREVPKKKASEFASSKRIPCFDVSAKTNENVIAAFSQVIREVRRCNPDVAPKPKKKSDCILV